MLIPGGVVIMQTILSFLDGAGTGDAFGVRLPFPRDLLHDDLIEGTGFAYQSFNNPQVIQPIVPRPFEQDQFIELNQQEDFWMGFQFEMYKEYGVQNIVNPPTTFSITSITINHNCPWTPTESEFTITPTTNNASGATLTFPYQVTAVTSTTFTVSWRGQLGSGGNIDFEWRLWARPNGGVNRYVGPTKPYLMGNLNGVYAQFYYASRAVA
jgi:hypothetical protein